MCVCVRARARRRSRDACVASLAERSHQHDAMRNAGGAGEHAQTLQYDGDGDVCVLYLLLPSTSLPILPLSLCLSVSRYRSLARSLSLPLPPPCPPPFDFGSRALLARVVSPASSDRIAQTSTGLALHQASARRAHLVCGACARPCASRSLFSLPFSIAQRPLFPLPLTRAFLVSRYLHLRRHLIRFFHAVPGTYKSTNGSEACSRWLLSLTPRVACAPLSSRAWHTFDQKHCHPAFVADVSPGIDQDPCPTAAAIAAPALLALDVAEPCLEVARLVKLASSNLLPTTAAACCAQNKQPAPPAVLPTPSACAAQASR